MSELTDRFMALIAELEDITDEISPADAARAIDDSALQRFWRQWPDISAWTGSLWRELDQDISDHASPATEGGVDVGGSD